MTQRTYSRDDVETHTTGYYGPSLPAVNVKVYARTPAFPVVDAPGVSEEWYDAYAEQNEWLFDAACEGGRESIEMNAEEIFGAHVKVWFEGRSGGWAVVDGLPDLDEWDAVQLGKWRRFEKWAKQEAASVPEQMVILAYFNGWLVEHTGPFPIAAEHVA
jgi:hypothetical protein